MGPTLAGSIYVWSFMKFNHFVLIEQQTWPPWAILNSDWLSFQKSSRKPLGQMEPNLAVSIYGMSYIKFVHFFPIGLQTCLPWAIFNSDWPIFQKIVSYETTRPNGTQYDRKHLCEVVYKKLFISDNNYGPLGQFLFFISRKL